MKRTEGKYNPLRPEKQERKKAHKLTQLEKENKGLKTFLISVGIWAIGLQMKVSDQNKLLERLYPYQFRLTVVATDTNEFLTDYTFQYIQEIPGVPASGGRIIDGEDGVRIVRGVA